MNTLHTAAQQALEALESVNDTDSDMGWAYDFSEAIAALRAALNQPVPQDFDSWWDSGQQADNNPFSMETPIYWAYEGWQAAKGK